MQLIEVMIDILIVAIRFAVGFVLTVRRGDSTSLTAGRPAPIMIDGDERRIRLTVGGEYQNRTFN